MKRREFLMAGAGLAGLAFTRNLFGQESYRKRISRIKRCLPRYEDDSRYVEPGSLEDNDLISIVLSELEEKEPKGIMFGECHVFMDDDYKGTRSRADNDFFSKLLPDLLQIGYRNLFLELQVDFPDPSYRALVNAARGDMAVDFDPNKSNKRSNSIDPKTKRKIEFVCPGWLDMIQVITNYSKLGQLKVFLYDLPGYDFNDRDKKAFDNMKTLFFDKKPDEKFIVYCGADHCPKKRHYIPPEGEKPSPGEYTEPLGMHIVDRIGADKVLSISLPRVEKRPPYVDYHFNLVPRQ